MHWSALTRTQRRTRRPGSSTRNRRAALKNRLAGHWTSGCGRDVPPIGTPAALAAEPDAKELCKPAEARFAERSSAARELLEAAEPPDAPQWEPLAERSPEPPEAAPLPEQE